MEFQSHDARHWGKDGQKLAAKLLEVVRNTPVPFPERIPYFGIGETDEESPLVIPKAQYIVKHHYITEKKGSGLKAINL